MKIASRLLGQSNRAHSIAVLHCFLMGSMADELLVSNARQLSQIEMKSLVTIRVLGRASDDPYFRA